VDSSVWIDHLKRGDPGLTAQLMAGSVVMHPFVLGELSLGNLGSRRTTTLDDLRHVPEIARATMSEVGELIENLQLYGKGIGYIDAHLLASVLIAGDATLWTRDKKLLECARKMSVGYEERGARTETE
jgi:predicted nucleic acid-binding protein